LRYDIIVGAGSAADERLEREPTTNSHIAGTCKMEGSSDAMTVVDLYGKVYRLDGVRLVEASIMPLLEPASINLTVLMVAEKMAAFMRQGK
jgi:5-(hydroxymethyl)furfural/furfural oxidase